MLNKERLTEIIKNPDQIQKEDVHLLQQWIEKYPYFQLAYSILAKVYQDIGMPEKQNKLNTAAIYSPNRQVLKKIITTSWDSLSKNNQKIDHSDLDHSIPKPTNWQEPYSPATNDLVTSEEYNNDHGENKHTIQETFNEFENSKEETPAPRVNYELANEVMENLERAKRIKQRYIDQSKAFDTILSYLKEVDPQNPEAQEDLLSNNNDHINSEQKKQQEIIDQFIENEEKYSRFQPRMNNNSESLVDLSEKSGLANEDEFISENLATILRKQGKKEKAIDIYKKLIWKFPQKRAYFASLIEELKK